MALTFIIYYVGIYTDTLINIGDRARVLKKSVSRASDMSQV